MEFMRRTTEFELNKSSVYRLIIEKGLEKIMEDYGIENNVRLDVNPNLPTKVNSNLYPRQDITLLDIDCKSPSHQVGEKL